MFSDKDILEDEYVINFTTSRNLKLNSIKIYKNCLKNYCNYTGLTPTQLIDEADQEQDNEIKQKNRKIKTYLQGFINHLINQKKSSQYYTYSFF